MNSILCEKCNKFSKIKDISVHKDDQDDSIFGFREKCWCPNCGAEIPIDPETVEGANPVFWCVALICLLAVAIIGIIPKPYSTIFALVLMLMLGVAISLKQYGMRKFFGIVLVFITIYLFFTLPIRF